MNTKRKDLILSTENIFDLDSMNEFISNASSSSNGANFRTQIVKELSNRLTTGKKAIAEKSLSEFKENPYGALKAIRSYSFLTDCVVQTCIELAMGYLNPKPGYNEQMAVMAIGGYGRGEMALHSDVDLLFLTSENRSDWVGNVIENVLYLLWDLKLKVGQSVRSIKDCIYLAKEDLTIKTAMLESRLVWGDSTIAESMHSRLWKEVFKNSGPAFVEAKLEEREERYAKQGGNRYVLEPNVKEGKGGLRDLQTLFWIMKYIYHVEDPRELITLDVFTIEEFEKFLSAESFLWSVRCEMHRIADHPQDKLHFGVQSEVAESLGYSSDGGRRAVEHFMQDYFRFATDVGELTRIFLTKLEEQHVKRQPLVRSWFRSARFRKNEKLPDEYKRDNGRLNVKEPENFIKDPVNILKLFETGLETELLIHPDAMRLVAANLHLIDNKLRNNPETSEIFINMLINCGNPERALRRMNETGLLGMLIPEFRDIVAMMQYNAYHHYTVDEHTIQCITVLAKIERGELKESLPLVSSILERGVNRRVLYIALLLHDVGKGKNTDHSILGAQISRKVTKRLGLDQNECELIEWLVANHLVMSDFAQKRDITNPATIKMFAERVENRTKLKLLTTLTVCDIMGVGPNVWTNWKAQMLRDLYRLTYHALTEGLPNITSMFGVDEAKIHFINALKNWDKVRLDEECERFPISYWQGLPTDAHVAVSQMLDGIGDNDIKLDLSNDKERGANRICFAMGETPELFPRLAGILLLVKANIVDARIYTSNDRHSVAVVWIQDKQGKPYEKVRTIRMKKQIENFIAKPQEAEQKLADPTLISATPAIGKRKGSFVVPTEISFDNYGSDIHTIIEVDTNDRPGLLYDLARTLYDAQLIIVGAVIATYGAQAVDVFYIKDKSGMKLLSKTRRQNLAQKLLTAIDSGAEKYAA